MKSSTKNIVLQVSMTLVPWLCVVCRFFNLVIVLLQIFVRSLHGRKPTLQVKASQILELKNSSLCVALEVLESWSLNNTGFILQNLFNVLTLPTSLGY